MADLPLCQLCLMADGTLPLTPPIGSANAAQPAYTCADCNSRLTTMLLDLPWLRYQMTQYRPVPAGTRNYWPDGRYFGV